MSLFHSILSQLQEKISKETLETETIAAIISETIHTTITKEQIVIQKNSLRLKIPPTLKMAVMLNQKKILQNLQDKNIAITTIV